MHGSRHGRHVSTSTLSEDPDADGEVDVEGEVDEGAGEGDGEVDDTLYCTCQRKSYGEMIGCDNDDCQFEWVSAYSLEEVESNTDALPSSTSVASVSRRRCQRRGTAQIVCADLDSPRATAPRRAGIKTRRAESGRSRGIRVD